MKALNALLTTNSTQHPTLWRVFCSTLLLLACFALMQGAQAVSPQPDGGYPGGNTAQGTSALATLTTGVWNTALGYQTLLRLTTGNQNTATGFQALLNITTGSLSVANGSQALYHNTTGSFDTATGFRALYNNTTPGGNTANGSQALYSNTIGSANTANGFQALQSNTRGIGNTAIGAIVLFKNTTGDSNTATGIGALSNNITCDSNTAFGTNALDNNTTVSNNVALGFDAGSALSTGSNNIDIGAVGMSGESDTIRLGRFGTQTRTFIVGISGSTVPGGVSVIIDNSGHLGTINSSARYKEAIRPMDKASEAILAPQPVTFRYKHELDPDGTPQFGLVAEQVEKIDPDLVARDDKGKSYTVRYEAVNAMLLNEFLKEHHKVQELESAVAQLTAHIEAQDSKLQKVSDQLEMGRPAPQVVSKQ